MEQAFPRFTGVKRRQELRFEQNGITVIEDFAHHPTEVRETLKALRERYPEKRIIAAFEPRSNTSQRAFFQEEYLQSFACADCSYLVSIAAPGGYAGRASGAAGLDVEKIVRELDAQGKDARAVANTAEMEQLILKVIRPGDLLVLMSNGSFGQLPERIPLRLLQPIAN
jgi:UDP-N-acetylmuramate: L-alanyl-gamma-D-glutamyl-meso-diaminopimelate ligase